MDFYLTYMSKWPDLFFTEGAPNGDLVGFGVGKIEGSLVDVVNPCFFIRASDLGLNGDEVLDSDFPFSLTFMKFIEDVSEKV